MPLLNRNSLPPGGFFYREPSLNWSTPDGKQPFDLIVAQIQRVRMQNPAAGLDPSTDAIAADLEAYTCARLRNDPRFCSGDRAAVAAAAATTRKPVPCASCGHRRKAA